MNALNIPTLRQHLEAQTPPHKTRAERIREYVAAHPGSKMTTIADDLGIPRPNVSSQLAEMLRDGTIHRAGLRCDYMHYADAASCQAAKDAAVRQIEAERIARKKAAIKRRNATRKTIRAAKIEAGEDVTRPISLKPREQRLEGRAEAYMRGHQGCITADIRAATGIAKNSVVWALNILMKEGIVFRVGKRGSTACTYYTDRAAYEVAQAAWMERQTAGQRKREAAVKERHAAERARIAQREAIRAQREADKAARDKASAEAKQRKQAAADKARERREEAARKKAAEAIARKAEKAAQALRPAQQTVNIRPTQTVVQDIAPNDPRIQRITPPRDPRAVVVPPGGGVISQDWAARRRGEQIPSRLQGAYA